MKCVEWERERERLQCNILTKEFVQGDGGVGGKNEKKKEKNQIKLKKEKKLKRGE